MTGGEARHVIAKKIDSVALCNVMQAVLIVFLEHQCPTFAGAPALSEGEAGEDGAGTPDRELKVLAFVVQIAIRARGDVFGQKLPAMLGHVRQMEKRNESGLLGSGECVVAVPIVVAEVVEKEVG